jgi:hypothetical protein
LGGDTKGKKTKDLFNLLIGDQEGGSKIVVGNKCQVGVRSLWCVREGVRVGGDASKEKSESADE